MPLSNEKMTFSVDKDEIRAFIGIPFDCQVVNPVGKAKWYSGKERKIIEIDELYVVQYYNQNMGGANRMDKNISFYRIPVRTTKWWMSLFIFMPDAAIQNAWRLYRH